MEERGSSSASKEFGVGVAKFVGYLFGEKRGDAKSSGRIDCECAAV